MHGTIKGINTAAIKYEERFLALMLKTKRQDDSCHVYYLQLPVLIDLLLVLNNRIEIIKKHIASEGETYRLALIEYSKNLLAETPEIDMAEIQYPDHGRRIMSLTLKPTATSATLIAVLQNEQIEVLQIDDRLVDVLLTAIQQSLNRAEDKEVIQYINTSLDFLMLYTIELQDKKSLNYQKYPQEAWRENLFSHYLAILFCFNTQGGKEILSGAVIKTSVAHHSEAEEEMLLRVINRSQKLKELSEQYSLNRMFTRTIPSTPGKMLSLEECLRPLHAFYQATQASLHD